MVYYQFIKVPRVITAHSLPGCNPPSDFGISVGAQINDILITPCLYTLHHNDDFTMSRTELDALTLAWEEAKREGRGSFLAIDVENHEATRE